VARQAPCAGAAVRVQKGNAREPTEAEKRRGGGFARKSNWDMFGGLALGA